MKHLIVIAALLAGFSLAQAQERMPRAEALKYAFYACQDLKKLLSTPIPTDPDVKRPIVVYEGDYGAMVLPETKLAADPLAQAGAQPVPVAQLWLHKLVPLDGTTAIRSDQLQMVTVQGENQEATLPLCALAVGKNANGKLELVVFGKAKDPVLRTPLKEITATQEEPVELAAERKEDGALLTLKILGKYEASFMVTDPEQF